MKLAHMIGFTVAGTMLTSCGSVEIENLAGCYQIDDAHAFEIGRDYRVFVDGQVIAQMRMSETEQGARYDSAPGLIAVTGDEGYSVQADSSTPQQAGFVDKTMFGSVYMLLPTGQAEPSEVEAYLIEGAEC